MHASGSSQEASFAMGQRTRLVATASGISAASRKLLAGSLVGSRFIVWELLTAAVDLSC